jgi:hypothetical protein
MNKAETNELSEYFFFKENNGYPLNWILDSRRPSEVVFLEPKFIEAGTFQKTSFISK